MSWRGGAGVAGRDKGEGQIRLKRVKVCKVGIEGVWTLMRRGWEVGRQGLGWWMEGLGGLNKGETIGKQKRYDPNIILKY